MSLQGEICEHEKYDLLETFMMVAFSSLLNFGVDRVYGNMIFTENVRYRQIYNNYHPIGMSSNLQLLQRSSFLFNFTFMVELLGLDHSFGIKKIL